MQICVAISGYLNFLEGGSMEGGGDVVRKTLNLAEGVGEFMSKNVEKC